MKPSPSTTVAPVPAVSGPFADPSPLPYRLPPFDRITDGDFKPGFEQGMAEQRREIEAIANNPAAPSFENTIVAMERSGRMLARVSAVFFNLSSSNTNDEIDRIESEMAPRLSAHEDSIYLDTKLFARVQAVYEQRQALGLDAEGLRLVERYHTDFLRAGAQLSDADKQKLKAMNERLSSLTTQFQQNVLTATQAGAVTFDSKAQLAGLSDSQIAAAAEAAKSRGAEGKYVITLQNTTTQPVLAQLSDRGSRERIYRASIARGNGGPGDTTPIVAEIVKLRAERAALLGYPTHADYVLEEETAKTSAAVNKMLGELAPPAVANARREAAKIQQVIDVEARRNGTKSFRLEPWDWQYYAEKVRVAEYSFDESQVKPYFELNHVLIDGVFYAASQLYGVRFEERHDLPVYQNDVRTFEVFDSDGSPMGLILIDYFARDNKQGGAWMNSFVDQSALFGTKPVVVNNLNIPKPPDGEPVLLTFDEVTTAFHEFGHALHGLFSDVHYPLFSGTNVPRDFVEYPSQYNEMWATDPKVLANYAKHYQTGETMPKALMDKVLAAQTFDQGYAATEYLAAAMLDQSWHQISAAQAPDAAGVMPFEVTALERAGVDYYAVPPRYHTTYFSHSFAGGYSAGYYAYIWSEVLAADTQHWMRSHGGLKRDNGDFLRRTVLSRGGSEDALALFHDFYGRDPEVQWLLQKRGLDTK